MSKTKEKREKELRLKVLTRVEEHGDVGALFPNWKQWLRAESLVDKGLLKRRMEVVRVTDRGDGTRNVDTRPVFRLTDMGESEIRALREELGE